MICIELLCTADVLVVPAIPLSRLVSPDQHDEVAAGVEREQDSDPAIDPRLLEFVQARVVYDVGMRPAYRRTPGQNSLDRGIDLRPALQVKGAPPALKLLRGNDPSVRSGCGTSGSRIDAMGHWRYEPDELELRPPTSTPHQICRVMRQIWRIRPHESHSHEYPRRRQTLSERTPHERLGQTESNAGEPSTTRAT
jgi:hypothetical protein